MLLSVIFTTILSTSLVSGEFAFGHDLDSLRGVWIKPDYSGNVVMLTGTAFVNPRDGTFRLPPDEYTRRNTSETLAFTEDGFWEQCIYQPQQIVVGDCTGMGAVMAYQHGAYEQHSNGSLTLTPFEEDGLYGVQGPCGSSTLPYFSSDYIESWSIDRDLMLRLVRPDTSVQELKLAVEPPQYMMLPTRSLNFSRFIGTAPVLAAHPLDSKLNVQS